MKTTRAWRYAALIACAGLGLTPALAQDKTAKIAVLNDMSSLYADIGGPNSVVAVKMAVQDSGLIAKGWKIDVLSGDHQNKPDVGVNMARQWIDVDKVDAILDTPNFERRARRLQPGEGQEFDPDQFGRRQRRHYRQGLHAEHAIGDLRYLHARQWHRQGADQGRRRQLVLPDRRLRLRVTRWSATPPRSSPPMAARCWVG